MHSALDSPLKEGWRRYSFSWNVARGVLHFVICYKLICRSGGIGIRGRLRACARKGVRVQVPPSAQE